MTKLCSKCNIVKEITEFNKNRTRKDGLQGFCKSCSKLASSHHYKNNTKYYVNKSKTQMTKLRNLIESIKSNSPCKDCGNTFDTVCMDFDHLTNKTCNVSDMPRTGCSMQKLLIEIAKCDLVCANCHRIRTKNRSKIL